MSKFDDDLSDLHLARLGIVCADAKRGGKAKVTIEEDELRAMVAELQRRRLDEKLRLSLTSPAAWSHGERP